MPYKDKGQQLECQREWYKQPENKKKAKKNIRERKKEIREWFKELKNTFKCIVCGESTAVCLDFHHENEKDKEHNISKMVKNGLSKRKILEELKKCKCLCSNCHRKYHAGLITLEDND